MRLVIILVIYGRQNFDLIEDFAEYVSRTHALSDFLIIQNDKCEMFPCVKNGTNIHGDNTLREFGAYDLGIEILRRDFLLAAEDVIVFINDSMFRSIELVENAKKRGIDAVRRVRRHGAVIAPVVIETGRFELFGVDMDRVFATYFIALSRHTLQTLEKISSTVDFDMYLRERFDGVDSPLFVSPSAPAFNGFYNDWLGVARPGGIGNWWASSGHPYSLQNFDFLREKAKMIILEAAFAVRLKRDGIIVIDLYGRTEFVQFLRQRRKLLGRFLRKIGIRR